MLSKHYTTVLTLAILLVWGITPKSLASSEKVNSNSFLEDKITTLGKDTFNDESIAYDSEEIILAQDASSGESDGNIDAKTNNSAKLWWLAPLVVLVPFLGFLLYRSGLQNAQADNKRVTAKNENHRVAVPSSTPSDVESELAVDSSTSNRLVPEDVAVATVNNATHETVSKTKILDEVETVDNRKIETVPEPEILDEVETVDNRKIETVSKPEILDELVIIDNPTHENIPESEVLDKVEEPIYNEQIQTENYVEEPNNEQLWVQSQPAEVASVTEEIISEPSTNAGVELISTFVDTENLNDSSVEKLTSLRAITSSEPNLLVETAEIDSEHAEPITDQDLANISEWLNEKVDSNEKNVSVMDDFWDNLSSITEEINSEEPTLHTESITDRELANISEWLNEKVDLNSSVNDTMDINLDDLSPRMEDKESKYNGNLVSTVDSNLKLEEEQKLNAEAKEGISDSTSDFLEDFLNEDSSREHK